MPSYNEYPHDRHNYRGGNWDQERYDLKPMRQTARVNPRDHRDDPYWSPDMERMRRIPAFRDNRGNDPYFEPRRPTGPMQDYDRNYNEEYGQEFNYRFEDSERWDRQGHPRWNDSGRPNDNRRFFDERDDRGRYTDDRGRNEYGRRNGGDDRGRFAQREMDSDNDWQGGEYRGYRNAAEEDERRSRGGYRDQGRGRW